MNTSRGDTLVENVRKLFHNCCPVEPDSILPKIQAACEGSFFIYNDVGVKSKF
jgi:hypothetical protein